MKPLIQKLPLSEQESFVAKTFRTPHFEVGWHQHIEYELILFTEGSGMSFSGNHVGEFETGDIYFLGSNLPHTFQKREPELITSAVVVQFRDDFWGNDFMRLPECRPILRLFDATRFGLKLGGTTRRQLGPMIEALEHAEGFKRIVTLGQCLELMAREKQFTQLSTQEPAQLNQKDGSAIDKVFQFTIDSFRDPITLTQVAAMAHMSVPAFCHYFKRSTKKTYVEFLNEVRVGYACRLLLETNKAVLDVCYESGYQTMANFHKQFLKVKQMTPLQYRKSFAPEIIERGGNIGIEPA